LQKKGESTRRWMKRWLSLWNSSNGKIPAKSAILIFKENFSFNSVVQKLQVTRVPVTTISELMEIAGRYANSDETEDESENDSDNNSGHRDRKGRHHSHNSGCDATATSARAMDPLSWSRKPLASRAATSKAVAPAATTTPPRQASGPHYQ
jgi:ABC-type Zn2+ transport system substrate-binding protein/surface adhesin